MNEIYVLKRRTADFIGDGQVQWECTGWTDDPHVVRQWFNGRTMHENRDYCIVKKITANANQTPKG